MLQTKLRQMPRVTRNIRNIHSLLLFVSVLLLLKFQVVSSFNRNINDDRIQVHQVYGT